MPAVGSRGGGAYMATPAPAPATPWREAEFCVIDLETTGLDAAVDEIVSFAALPIAGGSLRLEGFRYQLICPRRMPEAETIRIHGLRSRDLIDAPPLSAVLDGLLQALTGRVMVAHVASVEEAFLGAALRKHGLRLSNRIIDTAALACELQRRRRQPRTDPTDLSSLARGLGLPVHRPHHADGDALTTAQVFLALATHLDAFAPQTVGSLESYRRAPRGWPALRPVVRRILTRLTRR